MVLVIAGTRDQAKVVFGFIRDFLDFAPALRREVVNVTKEEITLRNGIVIAVHSNSFRTVRGRTLVAAIFDEVSFWRDEQSALPDLETYRAILPSLATTDGILIGISTPFRRMGLLFQKYRDHFGQDGDDILVVKGSTQTFNPTLSDETIAAQRAADPSGAISEWDAEFRDDLATFLDDRLIEAAIEHGRPLELPPQPVGYYKAFADAGGGGAHGDAYSIAIGHKEGALFIVDLVRGVPGPFDPFAVTKEFAELCKQYRVTTVTGDRWGKEWVQLAWRGTGIAYVQSALAKSDIYLECIPLFSRGIVRVPDHPKLLRELRLLQLQRHSGGRQSVDHPKGDHDDFANACCGVLRELSTYLGYDHTYRAFQPGFVDEDMVQPQPVAQPEPSAAQFFGTADWWRAMPRATQTTSANEKLRQLYGALSRFSR